MPRLKVRLQCARNAVTRCAGVETLSRERLRGALHPRHGGQAAVGILLHAKKLGYKGKDIVVDDQLYAVAKASLWSLGRRSSAALSLTIQTSAPANFHRDRDGSNWTAWWSKLNANLSAV